MPATPSQEAFLSGLNPNGVFTDHLGCVGIAELIGQYTEPQNAPLDTIREDGQVIRLTHLQAHAPAAGSTALNELPR